jgi:predicted transposase/invertase (TIGR01784 family)
MAKKYEELNRSYVIYICQFNIRKNAGLHKYSFANLCRENTAIELGDEAEKIFLCAQGTADDVSEKMKSFLAYVAGSRPSSEFTAQLENAVQKARDHIQWRKEYMTRLERDERMREEGREEERVKTEMEAARANAAEKEASEAKREASKAKHEASAFREELERTKAILTALTKKYGISEQ